MDMVTKRMVEEAVWLHLHVHHGLFHPHVNLDIATNTVTCGIDRDPQGLPDRYGEYALVYQRENLPPRKRQE